MAILKERPRFLEDMFGSHLGSERLKHRTSPESVPERGQESRVKGIAGAQPFVNAQPARFMSRTAGESSSGNSSLGPLTIADGRSKRPNMFMVPIFRIELLGAQ